MSQENFYLVQEEEKCGELDVFQKSIGSAEELNFENKHLYSVSKEQLFKQNREDDNDLINQNLDSTRNSIGILHQYKRNHQRETSPDLKEYSNLATSFIDRQPSKKLDNMIEYISRQLQQECKNQVSSIEDEPLYDQKFINKNVLKLQSYFRMAICRKIFKQKLKWAQYRKHVIYELYESEIRYVDDLKLIINQVLQPIKTQLILDEDQIRKLFNNIEAICWLNEDFLKALEVKMKKFGHFQIIGDIAVKFVQFFKIYYDYFQNFSVDSVEILKSESKNLDDFIIQCEQEHNMFRGLNLEAFLVKPVQRLPKYVLLFKDLLKHTETCHPDYNNLKKALAGFQEVNHHINNKINKTVQNFKLFELQQAFGDQLVEPLLSATREFIAEETLTIVDKQTERSVIVYFITDVLLITERGERSEKLFKIIYLNENSFCKNLPDYKHFSDIFTLIGKHKSITFLCGSKQNKLKIMALIQQLITDLASRSQLKRDQTDKSVHKKFFPVKVTTLGTEERQTLISKFTVYIVQISIGDVQLKIFVRYREMVELEEMVRKEFTKMELPHLSTENWFNNHKTKVIEARKIQIENFLQLLLQSKQVSQDPAKWLTFLDLPQGFYYLGDIEPIQTSINQIDDPAQELINQLDRETRPQNIPKIKFKKAASQSRLSLGETTNRFLMNQQNMIPLNQSQKITIQRDRDDTNSQSVSPLNSNSYQIVSASDIFKCSRGGPSSKLQRGSFQGASQGFELPSWKFKLPDIVERIQIYLMDDKIVSVEISDYSRSGDVIEQVAKEIDLKAFLDFKLVICYNSTKKTQRVLDDDEILVKVFLHAKSIKKNKETSMFDFVSKLQSYMEQKEKANTRIYMKKILYLPNAQEHEDYKNDPIFEEIRSDFYYLGFNEFCLYTALYLFIKYNDMQAKIFTPLNFPKDILKEILPQRILRSVKESLWADNIFPFLKRIRTEVRMLQKERIACLKEEEEEEKINQNFLEQIDKAYLGELLLIRQISLHSMYGVAMFYVQTVSRTQSEAKQCIETYIPTNVYLGFSFVWFLVISPITFNPLCRFKIAQLRDIQYYPANITFTVQDIDNLVFRFNTLQVFEIQRLLKEYEDMRTLDLASHSYIEDSDKN